MVSSAAVAGPRVLGYLSTPTARPGQRVALHAFLLDPQATLEPFDLAVERLDSGETSSLVRPIADVVTSQRRCAGSFGVAPLAGNPESLAVLCWVRWRRLPRVDQVVVALSSTVAGVPTPRVTRTMLTPDGLVLGHDSARTAPIPCREEVWHLVGLAVSEERVTLDVLDAEGRTIGRTALPRQRHLVPFTHVSVGAEATGPSSSCGHLDARVGPIAVFGGFRDGILDDLVSEPLDTVTRDPDCRSVWDLSDCADLGKRTEVGGGGAYTVAAAGGSFPTNLVVVNAPTDGLAGHVANMRSVEFSSTDLDDARAPQIAWIEVGPTEPPGVLAARITAAGSTAALPLVVAPTASVRPVRHRRPRRALFLFPTFTYTAYANHRQSSEGEYFGDYRGVTDRPVTLDATNAYLNSDHGLGDSLYDRRRDGGSAVYSSLRRPVLNLDADYRWWLTGGHRHFPTDLRFWRWLQQTGVVDVDAATDHDLHLQGDALLDGYSLLVTGSHPEYVSSSMLNAVDGFVRTGGDLAYLGGNGFYWRAETHPAAPHRLEVRRFGENSWWSQSSPEEATMTTALGVDRRGGLWSHLGRPSEALVGTAFVAQGWARAAPYRRLPDADVPEAAFIFEGIPHDALIGDFGDALGGAAGDEIDFLPPHLSPAAGRQPLLLATSHGLHPPLFEVSARFSATVDAGSVRSDMVFIPRQDGAGAVFSVGSICWTASVTAETQGSNYAAKVTQNVLSGLLQA